MEGGHNAPPPHVNDSKKSPRLVRFIGKVEIVALVIRFALIFFVVLFCACFARNLQMIV